MLAQLFKCTMIGIGAYLFAVNVGEFDTESAAAYGLFIGGIVFALEKTEQDTQENTDDQA